MIQSYYDDDDHDDGAKIGGGDIRLLLGYDQAEMMTMMKILMTILCDYDDDNDCDHDGENEEGGLLKQRRERSPFP